MNFQELSSKMLKLAGELNFVIKLLFKAGSLKLLTFVCVCADTAEDGYIQSTER